MIETCLLGDNRNRKIGFNKQTFHAFKPSTTNDDSRASLDHHRETAFENTARYLQRFLHVNDLNWAVAVVANELHTSGDKRVIGRKRIG